MQQLEDVRCVGLLRQHINGSLQASELKNRVTLPVCSYSGVKTTSEALERKIRRRVHQGGVIHPFAGRAGIITALGAKRGSS